MKVQNGFASFWLLLQLLTGSLLALKMLQQQFIDEAQLDLAEQQWIKLEAEYQSWFQQATQYVWPYPSQQGYRYAPHSQVTYTLRSLNYPSSLRDLHYATLHIEWKSNPLQRLDGYTHTKERTVLLKCISPSIQRNPCVIIS